MKECLVCNKGPEDKPLVFRSEPYCSDHCRKVLAGEIEPTDKEWASMNGSTWRALHNHWFEDKDDD